MVHIALVLSPSHQTSKPTCHCAACVRTLQTMVLFIFAVLMLPGRLTKFHAFYLFWSLFIAMKVFRSSVSQPDGWDHQVQSGESEKTFILCKITFIISDIRITFIIFANKLLDNSIPTFTQAKKSLESLL